MKQHKTQMSSGVRMKGQEEPRLPQPFFLTFFSIYLKNNIYKLLLYLY